jgi:sigma54-dependent transcription regulator
VDGAEEVEEGLVRILVGGEFALDDLGEVGSEVNFLRRTRVERKKGGKEIKEWAVAPFWWI